jgi:hypothetical protein
MSWLFVGLIEGAGPFTSDLGEAGDMGRCRRGPADGGQRESTAHATRRRDAPEKFAMRYFWCESYVRRTYMRYGCRLRAQRLAVPLPMRAAGAKRQRPSSLRDPVTRRHRQLMRMARRHAYLGSGGGVTCPVKVRTGPLVAGRQACAPAVPAADV